MVKQEIKHPNSQPMYFTSLKIKNVKCFGGEQELNLLNTDGTVSRWTLILGDNGVGKTTLLKCLAYMVPVEQPEKAEYVERLRIAKLLLKNGVAISTITEVTNLNNKEIKRRKKKNIKIKPSMDDFDDENIFDKLIRFGDNMKTSVKASFAIDCRLDQIPSFKNIATISIDFARIKGKLEIVTPYVAEVNHFNSPSIYAYNASRHMALKNFEKPELNDPVYNLFSESGDLYDAEQILTYLDYAAIKESIENGKKAEKEKTWTSTDLLKKVKLLLCDLLPNIVDPENIIINPPINELGEKNEKLVEIQMPYGKIPLFDVSLGYQTMLSWAVDLAIRMLWRNPESANPLIEPAVVIIDEIDLHLHPKWQRTLKSFLTFHFKNTQFICTAHSPFMAQSSETENLCVLNTINEEVHIENHPNIVKGWRIGQIVTSDLFGVPERSLDIENKFEERRAVLDTSFGKKLNKKRLKVLDDEIALLPNSLDLDTQNMLNQIHETAEFLKNEGKLK